MLIETEVTFFKRGLVKGTGKAITDGEVATEANMTIIIPDIFNQFVPLARNNFLMN